MRKSKPSNSCCHDSCKNERKKYCKVHKMTMCNQHWNVHHIRCKTEEIRTSDELREIAQVTKAMMNAIYNYDKLYPSLRSLIEGFEGKIHDFDSQLTHILAEVKEAFQRDDFLQFSALHSSLFNFQDKLRESTLYKEYSDFVIGKEQEKVMGLDLSTNASAEHMKELLVSKRRLEDSISRLRDLQLQKLEEKDKNVEGLEGKLEESKRKIESLKEENEAAAIESAQIKEQKREEINELETKIEEQKSAIETKNSEIDSLSEELKQEQSKVEGFVQRSEKFATLILPKLYHWITGVSHTFEDNSQFLSDLSNFTERNFLKEVVNLNIKFPTLKQVMFDHFKENYSEMNKFMEDIFPSYVRSLVLWCEGEHKMSNHCGSLIKSIPSVTFEVFLRYFLISKGEFESIVNTSKCTKLVFSCCNIDTSSSFTFTNSSITHLSFQDCGNYERSDWENNEEKFRNIMKGIANSPMMDNIQKINVSNCGLSLKRMKEITLGQGIDEFKVVDGGQWMPIED